MPSCSARAFRSSFVGSDGRLGGLEVGVGGGLVGELVEVVGLAGLDEAEADLLHGALEPSGS
jgi:hypothetical protein